MGDRSGLEVQKTHAGGGTGISKMGRSLLEEAGSRVFTRCSTGKGNQQDERGWGLKRGGRGSARNVENVVRKGVLRWSGRGKNGHRRSRKKVINWKKS